MASVAEKLGELSGLVRGLTAAQEHAISENNRRWEEHQKMLDVKFKEQGERLGDVEKALDKKVDDLYAYINDVNKALTTRINDHIESKRHTSNGNGNSKTDGDWKDVLKGPVAKYGGLTIGGFSLSEFIHWLGAHVHVN